MQALHSWCWFHISFFDTNIINMESSIKRCSVWKEGVLEISKNNSKLLDGWLESLKNNFKGSFLVGVRASCLRLC